MNNKPKNKIVTALKIGDNVNIIDPVNIYGCIIEDDCFIGPFVEIQKGVIVRQGARISSHAFICTGVEIGEGTFVGHGVMFVNDLFSDSSSLKNWKPRKTRIGKNVRIGSNATILPVNVGDNAIIGAGSVVTRDVLPGSVVCGNPARPTKKSVIS